GRGRRPRGEKGGDEGAETARTPTSRDEGAPAPETPAANPSAEEAGRTEPGEASPPRDWPRLMESAEHRTTEGSKSSPDLPDEELSFSMRPSQETRALPQPARPESRQEVPPPFE